MGNQAKGFKLQHSVLRLVLDTTAICPEVSLKKITGLSYPPKNSPPSGIAVDNGNDLRRSQVRRSVHLMSVMEILQELPKLLPTEREAIMHRIEEIDGAETPEMLAAVDEGIRSAEKGGGISIGEARRRVSQWVSK